jgi:iron complex outermembrane receptor protein
MSKIASCLLAGVALMPFAARAQQASAPLPNIDVYADRYSSDDGQFSGEAKPAPSATIISRNAIASRAPVTNDSAHMLSGAPGVSFQTGGPISSLPIIHGLNDDRNVVVLGGVPISSACANHMNPPLSYIDPVAIGSVEVLTVNVPVSNGGDSIGGSIIVKPRDPVFAGASAPAIVKGAAPAVVEGPAPILWPLGPGVVASGSVSTFYRSNGDGLSVSGHANVATDHFSLQYDGAWSKAGNYNAGDGSVVRSTGYEAQNQSATLSYRNEDQLLAFHYAFQNIPYQGFVNQYMDMLGNLGNTFDLSYKGGFAWGRLEASAYYHLTQHYMNFLEDRVGFVTTPQTGMPMYVNGQDYGYKLKGEIIASQIDLVRVGSELHMQTLNEWWPPVLPSGTGMSGMGMGGMSMSMMCCSTFVNVNNGQRNVLSTFAEWERRWTNQWSTLVGVRNDTVWMNTGDVQGYNMMTYGKNAAAFNAQDHAKTNINFDATALVRYAVDPSAQYEFGYTRKTRSPSIYERYAWSTNAMAASMIGWFGDGNGYVGNLNLNPEVAHTIAATAHWSDPTQQAWDVKLTPYYAYVQDYIDVDQIGTIGMGANATNLLGFANHNAELYGFDISGRALIARTADYGDFSISGVGGYVRGWRTDTSMNLYHMMPLNGKAALENAIVIFGGRLTSTAEVQAAAAKTLVQSVRLEPTTPAYAIVNLRTAFEYRNLRFDLGFENLGNQMYYSPLGGIDIADWKAGANALLHTPVAAVGRTIYGGVTARF